jgi:protein TonB
LQRRKAQLAVGSGGSEASNYTAQIYRSIRKFYVIPETYRVRGDSLTAQIKMSISPSGAILVMEVENSSGETGFDQLVMDIIRKAEPLPAPPTELIGKQLLMSFNP